jgi:hypothetical protein
MIELTKAAVLGDSREVKVRLGTYEIIRCHKNKLIV